MEAVLNVFQIKVNHSDDLDEYEEHYKAAKPWSEEKVHFNFLISQIALDERRPLALRQRAASIIFEVSDAMTVISTVFPTVHNEYLETRKRLKG
jgi:hypothetical protein